MIAQIKRGEEVMGVTPEQVEAGHSIYTKQTLAAQRCLNSQQISITMLADAADEMVLACLQAYLPERAKSGDKFFCNTTNLRVALGKVDKSNAENKICDKYPSQIKRTQPTTVE